MNRRGLHPAKERDLTLAEGVLDLGQFAKPARMGWFVKPGRDHGE